MENEIHQMDEIAAMSFNTIPSELIQVPNYDVYFWHPIEEQLYSIKVTGTLRPIKFSRERYVGGIGTIRAGFAVSRKGRKSILSKEGLRKLSPHKYEVPYENWSRV